MLFDEKKFARQMSWLLKLRKLSDVKLKALHKKTFSGTRWDISIPPWVHRELLERRLWYHFAAKNYHYPKKHKLTRIFRKKAAHILSADYLKSIDPQEDALQTTRDEKKFSKKRCKAMPIKEVDRVLASLGLYVEADENSRRRCLWEWFNRRPKDLPRHYNPDGRKVRKHHRSRGDNQLYLVDIIKENPSMDFDTFWAMFGNRMPSTTRNSFNATRSYLRKLGHPIAVLPRGPKNPVQDKKIRRK